MVKFMAKDLRNMVRIQTTVYAALRIGAECSMGNSPSDVNEEPVT